MSTLKRYNGTSWETIGGVVTGDTLPIGSEVDYDGASAPAGWEEVDDPIPKTIWTGTLYGNQSVTLSGVKNKLIIYARNNIIASIVYVLDLTPVTGKQLYFASGTEQSFDTASGLEFYTSESKFNIDTKEFTHTRTGYINITNHTFTQRNYGDTAYNGYYIYKIETTD